MAEKKKNSLGLYWIVSATVALVGCASIKQNTSPARAASTAEPKSAPFTKAEIEEEASSNIADNEFHPDSIENMSIDEVIRMEEPNTQNLYDDSRYDFPITMNSRVEGWIDYFTSRGRPHMERYLARSSRYIPTMQAILKKHGLPEDLVYLALIESGFNLRAKSRARAVGPWQFMTATGRRYRLRVDAWIDERRDPIKSTVAAAQYLKDLYLMFESWYLAASAYNAGEYKILRAIENLKTNNYWRICQTRLLRRETKDYIPKLIAAAIIAKNPDKYGFAEVEYEEPLRYETVNVDFPLPLKDLAEMMNVSAEDLEDLNPALRKGVIPPGLDYQLLVPSGTRALVNRALAYLRAQSDKVLMPAQYTVRHGDTIAAIAQKHRVRPRDLANYNNLSTREKLSPGMIILLPTAERRQIASKPKREISSIDKSKTAPAGEKEFTHKVKPGESLWSIAEKYDVTVQDLFRWNGLKKSQIQAGKKLKIRAETPFQDNALNGTHGKIELNTHFSSGTKSLG